MWRMQIRELTIPDSYFYLTEIFKSALHNGILILVQQLNNCA